MVLPEPPPIGERRKPGHVGRPASSVPFLGCVVFTPFIGWVSRLTSSAGFDDFLLQFEVAVELERIESCALGLQLRFLFLTHLRRGQHPQERGLGVSIDPRRPSGFAFLLLQLVRREEVVEQVAQRALAERVDQRHDRRVVEWIPKLGNLPKAASSSPSLMLTLQAVIPRRLYRQPPRSARRVSRWNS